MSSLPPESEVPADEKTTGGAASAGHRTGDHSEAQGPSLALRAGRDQDDEPLTAAAPTFKSLPQQQATRNRTNLDDLPGPGQQFGDFELLSLLGSGSFARLPCPASLARATGGPKNLREPRGRGADPGELGARPHRSRVLGGRSTGKAIFDSCACNMYRERRWRA